MIRLYGIIFDIMLLKINLRCKISLFSFTAKLAVLGWKYLRAQKNNIYLVMPRYLLLVLLSYWALTEIRRDKKSAWKLKTACTYENSRKTASLTYTNFVRIVRDDVQDRKFAKFFKFVRTRILYVLFVCTYLTALNRSRRLSLILFCFHPRA